MGQRLDMERLPEKEITRHSVGLFNKSTGAGHVLRYTSSVSRDIGSVQTDEHGAGYLARSWAETRG